jgi:hypothetical protein
LPSAYFGVTIDDRRSRKEKRNLAAATANAAAAAISSREEAGQGERGEKGRFLLGTVGNDIHVYATGLNMPVGYTQMMEVVKSAKNGRKR